MLKLLEDCVVNAKVGSMMHENAASAAAVEMRMVNMFVVLCGMGTSVEFSSVVK